jgi:hypothetical protein
MRDWQTKRQPGTGRGNGGPPSDSGAAARRALTGGSPTGVAPHAGQLGRTRKPVAQAVTQSRGPHPRNLTGPVPAPGIVSPSRDHSQGRTSSLRCGRSTLSVIFPGKTRHLSGGRGRWRGFDRSSYLQGSGRQPLRRGSYQNHEPPGYPPRVASGQRHRQSTTGVYDETY